MSAALGIPPNVLVADLREWPEGEDEAPRLTIRRVIWILASDTVFVNSTNIFCTSLIKFVHRVLA